MVQIYSSSSFLGYLSPCYTSLHPCNNKIIQISLAQLVLVVIVLTFSLHCWGDHNEFMQIRRRGTLLPGGNMPAGDMLSYQFNEPSWGGNVTIRTFPTQSFATNLNKLLPAALISLFRRVTHSLSERRENKNQPRFGMSGRSSILV